MLRHLHPQLLTPATREGTSGTDELLRRQMYVRARAACLSQPSAAAVIEVMKPYSKRALVCRRGPLHLKFMQLVK